MNEKDIYDKLCNIFMNRFEIDLETVSKENFYKHLLGNEFGLAPRDLFYIYLDIEREFCITIPDEDIAAGGLSTVNRIIEMVEQQLHISQESAI